MGVIQGSGNSRIIFGKVIKDAEQSTFGAKNYPKTRFTVAVSSDKNDKNGLLSCNALFEMAKNCAQIRKGDQVLVGGALESYEGKDGTKRYSLNVEFAMKSLTAVDVPNDPELEGFETIESEELPF